ncbi:hypothetical protein H072_11439 [Dactylellina haptotyla CBS 200.50]|uniref:Enoyl reductase (ER) domain-containing protein n=1 Tax=Dactylellina haptotyla (strain CBS 200.50) TaxID=1284197 RepID=S8A249_DACHA|nr:hypothetical protein H072_11439 [Dactylellina haptotyla CBS 200.50]
MRSFYLPGFGKPSTYKLGALPKPTVSQPDHILIKVYAASLNPIDMRYAEGTMKLMMPTQEFPSKLGYDTSGVIEDLGEAAKTDGWKVGDEVFVRLPHEHRGSLSEYALTTTYYIARKPANISHVEAASLPLVSMTAYQAMGRFEGGREALQGKTVLVTAGMGGAGSIGVQLMKAFGAKEVITTISGSKIPRAKELFGNVVDRYIDYKTEDPAKAIEPRSLDFILDTAGGTIYPLFHLLKEQHRFVSIAAIPSGSDMKNMMPDTPWYVSFALNMNSRWKITGPASKENIIYEYHRLSPNGADLSAVAKLVEAGQVKAVVGDVFDFDEAGCIKAAELVQGNGSPKGGKVVIKIAE